MGQAPFDSNELTPLDWTGTNIRVESQKKEKLQESVQYRAITEMKHEHGTLSSTTTAPARSPTSSPSHRRGGLLVKLVTASTRTATRRAHGSTTLRGMRPDAEVDHVAAQRPDTLFRVLRTARARSRREGVSPFEVGDIRKLYEFTSSPWCCAGASRSSLPSPDSPQPRRPPSNWTCWPLHRSYLQTTIKAPLTVWCSQSKPHRVPPAEHSTLVRSRERQLVRALG